LLRHAAVRNGQLYLHHDMSLEHLDVCAVPASRPLTSFSFVVGLQSQGVLFHLFSSMPSTPFFFVLFLSLQLLALGV
jgi:hypothetical protein